jgi:adenine deaminase
LNRIDRDRDSLELASAKPRAGIAAVDRGTEPPQQESSAGADPALLQRRVRVALGQEPGDLLVAGGQVVNVFTRQIEPADIVIVDGWIAGVGPGPWRADRTIAAAGQVVLPGLIDTHMHLESTLLTPAELARLVVPMGTTAVISDSHEIGNVLGLRGIDMLIAASAGLPLDLFFMASSCVPATEWEDAGAVFGPRQIRELLARPRVLGLAEVMDIPAVLGGGAEVFEKISAALAHGVVVDGHAPGLKGRDLIAYAAAGIRSDHESTTTEEARARAALGMLVQVRDGSSAQNLDTLLPLLASGAIDDAWCLVTDDIFPNDLLRQGHIDGMLRRLVAGGVAPAVAVRHATLVPARHFGLRDRGAVAPGHRADLALVADVHDFVVQTVIKNGRIVATDGRTLEAVSTPVLNHENTVHLPPLAESSFRLPLASDLCPVIEIVPDQIVTRRVERHVRRFAGAWQFDAGHDVALVANIERHRATGRLGLGLVGGLGLTSAGAIGSSVAHDSHNLIVAGTNPCDMLVAARALAEHGGGFVVVADAEVRAILPLPVAGLLSLASADVVSRQLAEVNQAARVLGCRLQAPFGTLSFLALSVIPELRITTRGLFDVHEQRFLTL